jgi:type II secretory pathway pseudopilin PulG
LPVILVPVMGIVAAISVPVYMKYTSRADVVRALNDMKTVKSHLEEHYYRYETYPLTGEFQSFLVSSLGRIPSDPFNNERPYRYQSDGSTFTLWSIGPDRQDNHAMIRHEPFRSRGFLQQGDIILTSDLEIDEGDELFGTMPEGSDPGGEILTITPSRL